MKNIGGIGFISYGTNGSFSGNARNTDLLAGITHDLTKFLPTEFIPYANYYFGEQPVNESGQEKYNLAWLYHQKGISIISSSGSWFPATGKSSFSPYRINTERNDRRLARRGPGQEGS